MKKYKQYIKPVINKRSEKLLLAFALMGYPNYITTNTAYYIVTLFKNTPVNIFIHKYKAKFHTSSLPKHKRITVTAISKDITVTLKLLLAIDHD